MQEHNKSSEVRAARLRITHSQFEELRRYEDGYAHYMFHEPLASLTQRGWLERVPGSGVTLENSAWRITDAGREALAAYRVKWALPAVTHWLDPAQ